MPGGGGGTVVGVPGTSVDNPRLRSTDVAARRRGWNETCGGVGRGGVAAIHARRQQRHAARQVPDKNNEETEMVRPAVWLTPVPWNSALEYSHRGGGSMSGVTAGLQLV